MKLILNLMVLLAPAAVFAAGGGHHGEGHIPASTIMFQAINLTILFAAIIYFTTLLTLVSGFSYFWKNKHLFNDA